MSKKEWAIIILAIICGAGVLAAIFVDQDAYSCDKTPIVAKEGDDYWGYVEQYCDGNIQNASDDLVKFYGPNLVPGQVIYLPSSDECELSLTVMSNGNEYVYESCK